MASLSNLTILYLDEENISKKLKCIICLAPAINPRVHRGCNTVFCELCAHELLLSASQEEGQAQTTCCPTCRQECSEDSLQPNDLIKKLLDEVSVYCSNKGNGCEWADERGSLVTHLEQFCEFCGCENEECEWVGQEKDRDDHMDECEFVEVNCPDECGMTMERRFLPDHKHECQVCLELERQRQSMDLLSQCDSLNPSAEEMITMMVGGVVMTASRKVLTRYPESVLGVLFAEKDRPLKRNAEGNAVFIDTCKTSFGHVLSWLHQGIVCPEAGSGEFRLLKVEAAKWRLQELSDELEELSRRAHLNRKKEKSEANSQPQRKKAVVQDQKPSQQLQQVQVPPAKSVKTEKQERRIKPEQVEGKPAKAKTGTDGKQNPKSSSKASQGKGDTAKTPTKGTKITNVSTLKKK